MITYQRRVFMNGAHTYIELPRANIIDCYNKGMGHVDLSDQLRTVYRPDRWLRCKKWWFAIWLFLLGIAITNAYVLYGAVCVIDGVEAMSHRDFRKSIAFHLITTNARETTTRGSKHDGDSTELERAERHRDKRLEKSRGAVDSAGLAPLG